VKQSIVHGFLLGIAFSVGYVPLAIADIAPPPGYVEQCTVEKQQAVGKSCVACPNDYRSTFADAGPSACQVQYEPLGYTKACNSYGASVWTEVWCRADPDAGANTTPPTGGCAGCRTNTKRANGPVAGLLVLSTLVATRLLVRGKRS
jgi:hypothetical protein